MLLLSLPFKTPSEATSLLPLAPFTVNWTATPFPSSDDLLRPKKGSHPHLSAQEKHPDCKQKARGRSSPPRCSLSKRSGLERSLRCLSPCKGETELFHQGWRGICGGSLVCLVVSHRSISEQAHFSKRASGSSIALARRQMSQAVLRSCRQEACLSYSRHLSGRLFPTWSFPFAASSASSFSSGEPPSVYRARKFLPVRCLGSRG